MTAARPDEQHSPVRVTVFGAIALDVRIRAQAGLVPATSNPADAQDAPGGVGRNVAVALAQLGAVVHLASRIGVDAAGTWLLDDLAKAGVATRFVARTKEAATARYWAVLEPDGELALGLADMAVIDTAGPADFEHAATLPADAWLIDANLPETCIAGLLTHDSRPPLVAVDAVSVAKATRLERHLARIDLLFANADESRALVGEASCERFLERGAGAVVMGLDARGLVAGDAGGVTHLDALPITIQDVTGAGDALAAATLWGRLVGLDLAMAARLGRLAAAAVITGRGLPITTHLHDMASMFDKGLHEAFARFR